MQMVALYLRLLAKQSLGVEFSGGTSADKRLVYVKSLKNAYQFDFVEVEIQSAVAMVGGVAFNGYALVAGTHHEVRYADVVASVGYV